jgi:hypothetical protein
MLAWIIYYCAGTRGSKGAGVTPSPDNPDPLSLYPVAGRGYDSHILRLPDWRRVATRRLSSPTYEHSFGLTLRIVMLPYLLGSRLGLLSIVSFI